MSCSCKIMRLHDLQKNIQFRGEESQGSDFSPEWSPEDEPAEEEEEDGEEERLLRPRFEDEEEVCLSDAETLGSNGSDELTDYENSGIVEQQRNGEESKSQNFLWMEIRH